LRRRSAGTRWQAPPSLGAHKNVGLVEQEQAQRVAQPIWLRRLKRGSPRFAVGMRAGRLSARHWRKRSALGERPFGGRLLPIHVAPQKKDRASTPVPFRPSAQAVTTIPSTVSRRRARWCRAPAATALTGMTMPLHRCFFAAITVARDGRKGIVVWLREPTCR
jgi:hypothetical protein